MSDVNNDLKNSLNAEPVAPVIPVAPVVNEVPKTKEQWDKLKTESPDRWATLTQERMDTTIRQNREQAEKLQKERDKLKKRQICDEAVEILGQYGYTPSTARKIVLSAYEVGGWASGSALVEHLFSQGQEQNVKINQ